MSLSTRTTGILIASVLAVGSMGAAYALSGDLSTTAANAESTDELLRAYAAQDTDADGLADWQESLYGTDPTNAHSVNPEKTDREAVEAGEVKPRFASEEPGPLDTNAPGVLPAANTLTDKFAQQFFGTYLSSLDGTPPTEADLTSFVNEAVGSLAETQGTQFSSSDLKTVPDSADAFRTYAFSAGEAFAIDPIDAPLSEVQYFSDAVQKNDARALSNLKKIGTAYGTVARGLVAVPAPRTAASAHLRIANALGRMSAVVEDMAAFDRDPLRGLVGLSAYTDAVSELHAAFGGMHGAFQAGGVVLTPSDAGYSFYSVTESSAN